MGLHGDFLFEINIGERSRSMCNWRSRQKGLIEDFMVNYCVAGHTDIIQEYGVLDYYTTADLATLFDVHIGANCTSGTYDRICFKMKGRDQASIGTNSSG